MPRRYRLGRRREAVADTRAAILAAARQIVAEHGPQAGLSAVAERAGVSRITLYNQFGGKAQLLEALAEGAAASRTAPLPAAGDLDPIERLRLQIGHACAEWAEDPALYRQLPAGGPARDRSMDLAHDLAEGLAAADRLRPGCSVKEAEDAIGILTSFPAFDRLHKDGRRPAVAVAQILMRMAAGFLNRDAAV